MPTTAALGRSDFVIWDEPAFEPGSAILFDIRGPEGDMPIVERIRAMVEVGVAVGLTDSDGVMADFAVARVGEAFVVFTSTGQRSNFAKLEAALRHGMTDCEGYRRG